MTTLTDPTFPLGVSQWESHGRAFGYWDYFAKEAGKAYLLSVVPEAMKVSRFSPKPNEPSIGFTVGWNNCLAEIKRKAGI